MRIFFSFLFVICLACNLNAQNSKAFDRATKAYQDKDFFRAAFLFKESCMQDNDVDGCNNYASMLSIGRGVKLDIIKAIELFMNSCEKMNAEACNNAASIMINYSEDEVQNFSQIIKLYEKSCELGSSFGCFNAAVVHTNGIGTKFDTKKALLYYKKSCKLSSHVQSCSNAGVLLKENDPVLANEYFKKACAKNHALGCYNLGIFMSKHARNIEEANEAKKYLNRACELDEVLACEALQILDHDIKNSQ